MRYTEETINDEGGETFAPTAQGSCGYLIPGAVQGPLVWGTGHSDLVGGVPAHGRELEFDELWCSFQPKLLCYSVIL